MNTQRNSTTVRKEAVVINSANNMSHIRKSLRHGVRRSNTTPSHFKFVCRRERAKRSKKGEGEKQRLPIL